jgi:CRISPR system Cascade subunit CasC
MTTFVQFHLLTPYPPSNPNRDDQGRPKQVVVGGQPRLRLSSQSLKRAIRETAWFETGLAAHMGKRSRRPARWLLEQDGIRDADPAKRDPILKKLTEAFGKLDEEKTNAEEIPVLSTITFFSYAELRKMADICRRALSGEKLPERAKIADEVFNVVDGAIDVAMFGRMLAGESGDKSKSGDGEKKEKLKLKQFEREAAVQVSHAFTTHRALAEDDYYTAVDDLNKRDDLGQAYLDTAWFGSGVYYLYACVNVDLLVENLAGNKELAKRGMQALVKALATATPRGKQNSFAHHPLAHYVRAERGSRQPRDLSGAFFSPVPLTSNDLMRSSISALEVMAEKLERAYGSAADAVKILNVPDGIGSLDDIANFAAAAAVEPQIMLAHA